MLAVVEASRGCVACGAQLATISSDVWLSSEGVCVKEALSLVESVRLLLHSFIPSARYSYQIHAQQTVLGFVHVIVPAKDGSS